MITLKYFEPSDFDQLIEWSGDEAFLLQWAGKQFQFPLNKEQLKQYLNEANDMNSSDRLVYKVIDEISNQVIGHISLGVIDRHNRSGRVERVLVGDRTGRGKGYGKQMILEILRIGFDDLKLHRISLGVFDFNKSAIKCYESTGFVREGLLRDIRKYRDTYWNLIEMSILENEWARMKSN
ncbi:GNAT family N-acetyltransferase [Paenibacillus sp. HJL G12]|uniref:GNAT family N-acetyltransferase n=1 Tax=Paenibacillus dendrobii TaxID=2691084 RepID=A0A7X3IEP8_9BACL|nr:GNAT family protein [Paenibacillus dendrobii]MWV42543.1 GNAT family N-acetyltransferase [Paenibacillus dendrobii]